MRVLRLVFPAFLLGAASMSQGDEPGAAVVANPYVGASIVPMQPVTSGPQRQWNRSVAATASHDDSAARVAAARVEPARRLPRDPLLALRVATNIAGPTEAYRAEPQVASTPSYAARQPQPAFARSSLRFDREVAPASYDAMPSQRSPSAVAFASSQSTHTSSAPRYLPLDAATEATRLDPNPLRAASPTLPVAVDAANPLR
jgi:hypothetical protein